MKRPARIGMSQSKTSYAAIYDSKIISIIQSFKSQHQEMQKGSQPFAKRNEIFEKSIVGKG